MHAFRLDNGLAVRLEPMPQRRTCAIALWLGGGSRGDPPDQHGAAHLLEHLLVRRALAREGDLPLNGQTGRERIALFALVEAGEVPAVLQALVEAVTEMADGGEPVPPTAFEAERAAVLAELATADPDAATEDAALASLWPLTPLARTPAGDPAHVEALRPPDLAAAVRRTFCGLNLLLTVAGGFAPADVARLAAPLAALPAGSARAPMAPAASWPRRQPGWPLWWLPLPAGADPTAGTHLTQLLRDAPGGLLFDTLRADGQGYGCAAHYLAFTDRHGVLLRPRVAPAQISGAQTRIAATLAAAARHGVSAAQYAGARRCLHRQLAVTRDDLLACCSLLAARWARGPTPKVEPDRPLSPEALQALLRQAWSQRSGPL